MKKNMICLIGSLFVLVGAILMTPFSAEAQQCPISSFPYNEGFDTVSTPDFPCGWRVANNNNDTLDWDTYTGGYNSQFAASVRYNTSLQMDDWLFTPELMLQGGTTYELTFWYKTPAQSQQFKPESLEVLWGGGQNAGSMTDTLFDDPNVTNSTYQSVTQQFTPSTSGSYYIGFHGYSAPNKFRILVDQISLQELSQQCPKPTNITTTNYTSSTAQVQWSGNASNSFEIEYGPTGFSQGSGITVNGIASTSYTLTGLSPDTTYDVYVRQLCNQDTSNFGGPETFVLNDSCLYALPAACNATLQGTTVGATAENVTGTTCGTSINTPGVWYTFTGTGNMISATTCSQLTNYDTKISVFRGTCGNLVCVDGNDDFIGCPAQQNYSQVTWSSSVGVTYYILVHGANSKTGDFQLTVNTQGIADAGTDDTTCQGDTTTLTASGGTDYNWSTGDTTASIDVAPLSTTDYVVTVSTVNGCSDSDTVQVVATDSTDGGTVMTESGEDTVNVCIDNSPSVVAFDSTNNATSGASYSYIVTDASNTTVLGTPGSDQADFNPAGPGECHVWGVSHVGSLNAQQGQSVSSISADVCFELSDNYIVVYRDSVDSGSDVQVVDDGVTSDTTQICIDNAPDTLSFTNNSNATARTNYSYIATDQNNNILSSFDTKADFNQAGTGVCFVYGVSYVGNLTAQPSQPISSVSASVCSDVSSDYAVVLRDSVDGGQVNLESGDDTATVCIGSPSTFRQFDSTTQATQGADYTYIVTDSANTTVLRRLSGDGEDFSIAPPGEYHVWGVSHVGQLNASQQTPVPQITAGECYELSGNYVTVFVDSAVVDAGANDTICRGDTATLTASGNGSLSWSNGDSGASISASPSSTTDYTVTVSTQTGCTNVDTATVVVNANPTVTLDDPTICPNSSTTLDAGNPGADYIWNTQAQTQTITVSQAGDYSVTVTQNGCTGSDTATVTIGQGLSVSIDHDTICEGDTVTLDPGFSGSDFTYNWSTGDVSQTLQVSPDSTNSYSVTVTDTASNCTGADTATIHVNPLPNADAGPDKQICKGDSATLVASGGSMYQWNNNANGDSITVSPMQSSNYIVTVTDTNGCSSTDNVFVSVNDTSVSIDDQSICQGDSATLDPGGQWADYSWSTGDTTATITVDTAGSYAVTVTDALNGCSASDSAEVTVSASLNVDLGGNYEICQGDSVTLDAGATGDIYTWSNGAGSQTITVSTSNAYSVTVTDTSNGCSGSDTSIVTVNSLPNADAGSDREICQGDTASLQATGGSSYAWSTGDSVSSINVSPAQVTTYTVTVTDTNGCSATDDVNVAVNPNPSVNLPDPSICQGSSTVLDAGNQGSSYVWSTTDTTQTITVSNAGSYAVTVTDTNGCVGSDTANVTIGSSLSVDLGGDYDICQGDSVTLDAGFPGSTYDWNTNDSTQTITVATSGTYAVTVTDNNNCSGSDTSEVTVNQLPNADAGADQQICAGSSTTLIATGGTNYAWNNGAMDDTITVSPTASSGYIVTVTDARGCSAQDTVIVEVLQGPSVNIPDTSFCAGDSVTLDAGNPDADTYDWSNNQSTQTITVGQAGTYSVTVTDSAGCSDADTSEVTQRSNLTVNLGSPTACEGDTITLDAGNPGAQQYFWNTGATDQTIDVDSAGTYWVSVLDGNCSGADTTTVAFDTPPSVNVPDASFCQGGSTTLDAGNPDASSYQWSNNQTTQTITVSQAGSYSVTVTDSAGCKGSDTANVTQSSNLTVNLNSTTACEGDTVTLDAGNPGVQQYVWNNGQTGQTIDVTASGDYSVTVIDGNCTGSDTATVTFNQSPSVNVPDASFCPGSSTTLDAGNPNAVSYMWSNNQTAQTITVSQAGDYSVTVTDSAGCTGSDTATVTQSTNLTVNLGSPTACEGDTVTLDAGNPGAQQYVWNNAQTSQTIDVTSSGTYSVTVIDGNCTGSDTTTINLQALPQVDAGADKEICKGESVTLEVTTNGVGYTWNTGATSKEITVSPADTQKYHVTVTGNNNCQNADTVNVKVNNLPSVNIASVDSSFCENDEAITLSGTPLGGSYGGTAGVSGSMFDPSVAGTGTFEIYYTYTDNNSCTNSDTTIAKVFANPTVDIDAVDSTLCLEDDPITLSGTPDTGTFSGKGVSGNTFDPSASEIDPPETIGIYLKASNSNGCASTDTTAATVEVCPGIKQIKGVRDLSIYPNPFTNRINIDVHAEAQGKLDLELTDITGRTILKRQETITPGLQTLQLTTENKLAAGLYYLTITKDGHKKTMPLIRKR